VSQLGLFVSFFLETMIVSFELNPIFVENFKKWFLPCALIFAHIALTCWFVGEMLDRRSSQFVLICTTLVTSMFYTQAFGVLLILSDGGHLLVPHEKRYPLVYFVRCDTLAKKFLMAVLVAMPFALHSLGLFAEETGDTAARATYIFLVIATTVLPIPAFFILDVTIKE
jgi:hypothetical protein